MGKNYIHEILDLFTHNSYTDATNHKVQQWLADESHAELKQEELHNIWTRAGEEASLKGFEKSFKTMQMRTGMTTESRRSLPLYFWKAAAILFFGLSTVSLYWTWKTNKEPADILQCHIPKAMMQDFELPDGTHVMLNSQSTLLYPEEFNGSTRSVFLIGEAYFKVKPDKDKPFIVKANDFQVTALGTEFNVNAYPENVELKAMLVNGKIKVEFNELSSNVILNPDEELVYNTSTKEAQVAVTSAEEAIAWKNGILLFKNMKLEDIFTTLERKLPYTFIYSPKSMDNSTYSFRFSKDASLKEIMQIISQVVGKMHYEIRKDKCYIIKKVNVTP